MHIQWRRAGLSLRRARGIFPRGPPCPSGGGEGGGGVEVVRVEG